MFALTRKQHEIIDYLLQNQQTFARPPTFDELCAGLGLKSKGSLHHTLQGLIEAGLIEAPERKHRGIRITDKTKNLAKTHPETLNSLPYVGVIAAGKPLEAIEDHQVMLVPDELKTDGSCYVLKVKGDSMEEEGIFDGDWVVIEQRNYANNGEIVVALIDNHEATLKFIKQTPVETLLIPANSKMTAMRYHPSQVQVQGVLVGQMRSYCKR